jgi:hypothetical protein
MPYAENHAKNHTKSYRACDGKILHMTTPSSNEEILSGGNMNTVSRVGATVRRQPGPWSARVHQLLAHLRTSGIEQVPAPLGYDEQGREIFSYFPGAACLNANPDLLTEPVLESAGRLLRRIHDASQAVAQEWLDGWQANTRQPVEVICHGDFAPYNCIFDNQGLLVGVIDFDYAHPGSRAWDLAYALYRFVPIMAPSNPESFGDITDQARRARLFCRAYGVSWSANLIKVVEQRIQSMVDFLLEGAAVGDARRIANINAGHLEIYQNDRAHLAANAVAYLLDDN